MWMDFTKFFIQPPNPFYDYKYNSHEDDPLTCSISCLPENLAHLLMQNLVWAATSSYNGSFTSDSCCRLMAASVIEHNLCSKSEHNLLRYACCSGWVTSSSGRIKKTTITVWNLGLSKIKKDVYFNLFSLRSEIYEKLKKKFWNL